MEQPCPIVHLPEFDKKYKVIMKVPLDDSVFEKLEWANANTIGKVEIKGSKIDPTDSMYFAFENPSDATFFKIKYLL